MPEEEEGEEAQVLNSKNNKDFSDGEREDNRGTGRMLRVLPTN